MLDKKDLEKIEKIIKEFFEKATFNIQFSLEEKQEGVLVLNLEADEPQIYIGEYGKTLAEIQMILGRMVRKQTGLEIYLQVDINGYKENKEKHLEEMAQDMAGQAVASGVEKTFSPMPSYERRIIHTILAERQDVKTESIGEGEERRIVVRPV